ncbi:putative oxidoreductase [Kineococcus radiotolerans]|uniref:DoxX family protein n=2 Tax=Kineococcus radiotolerans TaxID=131568 RepID=A6WCU6_KINRD|nr:DoxX family protein [Kineococcus radiotolerans]ABS04635.1 DoxX family protein [Kineococcus radiotolerans SRS30216 = ATCC BAA-149]MBB2901477.1 putative oxidoreductase [Kineococcus radiotolerans]
MSSNDLSLLALRLGVGGTLVAHGAQKLFGAFGGGGIEGTAGAMHAMGFRPGKRNAVLAGASEAGGGALLVLGLATPVGGASAAAAMVAAAFVHKPNGFFTTSGGFEYPAVLGLVSAALAVSGPGRFSLDAATGHALNKRWTTVLALAGAGAGAYATIKQRQATVAADAQAQEAADAPADGPGTPVAS